MSALPHLLSKAEFDLALSPDTSRVIARGERFSLHFSPHLLPTPEAVTKARHKALLRAASRTAAADAASAPELCTDVHRLSHQPVDNFGANPESSHADKGLDASAGVPVPPCRTHGLTAAQREKIGQLLGPSPETLSVGVVVAKRFAKRAVMRNLIKRQSREAFRRHEPRLPRGLHVHGHAGDDLCGPNGLGDVVRAARVEGGQHVLGVGQAGHEDDGDVRRLGARLQAPRHLEAVQPRQIGRAHV